ncbi:MAG: hypothetical protein KDB14_02205 [Planctomycetales bacterium]|nr:hypothetical protein [Planctomycetales bacterium]
MTRGGGMSGPGYLTWNALAVLAVVAYALAQTSPIDGAEPFRIRVVDDSNGWPVPLVELRTTHHVRFVTDNTGVVAFDLPELMGVETWLHVEGHGYRVPADGFGYRGVRITPRPGESQEIKVHRELPAKRLGRITGGGLFAESQKLGSDLNWQEQGILGCDSVQNVLHNGKLFWAWGDTVLARYPLGRFHMIAATTAPRPLQRWEPPIRLRYDYFTDEAQLPRNTAEIAGPGPTWLTGFVSLPDQEGRQRLGATYSKIKPPLSEYERGLCVWNEETRNFERLKVLWRQSDDGRSGADRNRPSPAPLGHPVMWTEPSADKATDQTADKAPGQRTWLLFGDPFPALRCRPMFEAWSDPGSWEALTPQRAVPTRKPQAEPVTPHRGAIAWNRYRGRWVTVFTQLRGDSSTLGELWYAEADAPTGPWRGAVKVVTHNRYTFYNPQLHPEFTAPDSPQLLFEATYTHTFSKSAEPTPRHDYNQVLYRLDLDELGDVLPNE